MIGVFDSGVGGLSVLREIRALLHRHDILYLADQAYAPYGDRTLDDVRARVEWVVDTLLERGAQMITVACHTASAAALHRLRNRHPSVPFVGIEPAVKPAAATTASRTIGVLATSATFQGELFRDVVDRHAIGTRVIARPCPGLADLVESGADPAVIELALADHLGSLIARNADTIVLACTHYSFLADRVRALTGATVIDPAPAVARQVARIAASHDIAPGAGITTFMTTGEPELFASRVGDLLEIRAKVERLR
jgi:glutamate racemase